MFFDPVKRFLTDRCTACGICSSVCPASAIKPNTAGIPEFSMNRCIRCGHCGCYCPSNCFSLESTIDVKTSLEGQIESLFKNRRSTRSYKDQELSDNDISLLLEPLNWTPTGRNSQGIQVDIIRGRGRIEKLVLNRFLRILRFLDCFGMVTLLSGSQRDFIRRLKSGDDLLTWGAPCVLFFRTSWRSVTPVEDALIAASAVAFKAESMGMGTMWSGVIKILAPVLGLGRCHAVLLAGFPALKKYQSVPARKWVRREL